MIIQKVVLDYLCYCIAREMGRLSAGEKNELQQSKSQNELNSKTINEKPKFYSWEFRFFVVSKS